MSSMRRITNIIHNPTKPIAEKDYMAYSDYRVLIARCNKKFKNEKSITNVKAWEKAVNKAENRLPNNETITNTKLASQRKFIAAQRMEIEDAKNKLNIPNIDTEKKSPALDSKTKSISPPNTPSPICVSIPTPIISTPPPSPTVEVKEEKIAPIAKQPEITVLERIRVSLESTPLGIQNLTPALPKQPSSKKTAPPPLPIMIAKTMIDNDVDSCGCFPFFSFKRKPIKNESPNTKTKLHLTKYYKN